MVIGTYALKKNSNESTVSELPTLIGYNSLGKRKIFRTLKFYDLRKKNTGYESSYQFIKAQFYTINTSLLCSSFGL